MGVVSLDGLRGVFGVGGELGGEERFDALFGVGVVGGVVEVEPDGDMGEIARIVGEECGDGVEGQDAVGEGGRDFPEVGGPLEPGSVAQSVKDGVGIQWRPPFR